MTKKKTRILIEVTWDPEITDHPGSWDFAGLLQGDPFGREGDPRVRLVSFEDVDQNHDPDP